MKPISRSAGRSATAAAAYRAGVEVVDVRTGLVHDYTRKAGVIHAELILPGGAAANRGEFWNRVEHHHKRGDAVLAREIEVSLPAELDAAARQSLAVRYACELADRYGVGADIALHAPSSRGDERNYHAHILLSACGVTSSGSLGKKVIQLDPIACQKRGPGREAISSPVDYERPRWQELVNDALARAGSEARVDHRSNEARGLEAAPGVHLGPTSNQLERIGIRTRIGDANRRRHAQNARLRDERLKLAALQAVLEAESAFDHSLAHRRRVVRRVRQRVEQRVEQRARPSRNNGPRGP